MKPKTREEGARQTVKSGQISTIKASIQGPSGGYLTLSSACWIPFCTAILHSAPTTITPILPLPTAVAWPQCNLRRSSGCISHFKAPGQALSLYSPARSPFGVREGKIKSMERAFVILEVHGHAIHAVYIQFPLHHLHGWLWGWGKWHVAVR